MEPLSTDPWICLLAISDVQITVCLNKMTQTGKIITFQLFLYCIYILRLQLMWMYIYCDFFLSFVNLSLLPGFVIYGQFSKLSGYKSSHWIWKRHLCQTDKASPTGDAKQKAVTKQHAPPPPPKQKRAELFSVWVVQKPVQTPVQKPGVKAICTWYKNQ